MWETIKGWLFRFPAELDRWLRWRDLRFNRIDGSGLHRMGFVPGYSSLAMWLPIPVLFVLGYGMPKWRGIGLFFAFLAAVAVHIAVSRLFRERWVPRLQWALLSLFALGVFVLAGKKGWILEFEKSPYQHLFAVVGVAALTLGMPASRALADWLIGRHRERFRSAFLPHLNATQFLVTQKPGDDSGARVFRAYVLVPLTSPLMLAFFPALLVVGAPRGLVWPFFWATLVFTWMALASAHYNRRLRTFQLLLRQLFLVGAPLAVSLLIIVLAAARILDVDYVTTVLDQASARVIVSLAFILYLIFWLYDYWVQRAEAEVLLGLLTDDPQSRYPQQVKFDGGKMGGARLQIHGAGRWIAIKDRDASRIRRNNPLKDNAPPNFESYRPIEAFRRIVEQLEGRVRTNPDARDPDSVVDGEPRSWREFDDVCESLDVLTEKTRLHTAIPAIALALVLVAIGGRLWKVEQEPGATFAAAAAPELFQLEGVLRSADAREGEPLYALAFSGGGTRAALYSYSVLRGMHDRGALGRVVLTSSVSGGSAGAAYFATHHDDLVRTSTTDASWKRFRDAMAAPYIHDVLAGVGEWRFLHGVRLGRLLNEGFDRSFRGRGACETLDCAPFGMVFNTGVTGSWRKGETPGCLSGGRGRLDCARIVRAGSRLVMTNVDSMTEESSLSPVADWPLDLDYAVASSEGIRLSTAAALSANFPPIFSNARVDLGDEATYWVTDGGAIDNRGLISLLLALRSALDPAGSPVAPVPLRVVVAEASGLSVGYKEDRGLGAVGSSSSRIANKLIAELSREVERRWRRLGGGEFKVIYLPLPEMLRVHFGTHWQMPRRIEVSDPRSWYVKDEWYQKILQGKPSIELDPDQLLLAMDHLFDEDAASETREEDGGPRLPTLFWEWIEAGRHRGEANGPLARALDTIVEPTSSDAAGAGSPTVQ